ncbi:hypothetical protein DE146DRAFT_673709 [Phaeosphaeria sp. MPI-PUGE-AT-0046c]|nr:hypothetical protein DE146DRAFT_673709 [Phaeosphaeria sp. MPI-PUGE-AT-0046c]
MSSGSVFSGALQAITTTKLEELAQQRAAFDKEHAELLASAEAEQDPLQRLTLLVDGTKSCFGVNTGNTRGTNSARVSRIASAPMRQQQLGTDLNNLDRFLEQAKFDPSVSKKVVGDWEKSLRQYLSIQASKYQYADLYGKLVTEWLSSEKKTKSKDEDVEMAESYEELPGAKKLAARTEWEKSVFEPAVVDVDALRAYLEHIFIQDKKASASAIKELRTKVEQFENSLSGPAQFNASDLLPNEKREVLKDFLSNDVILGEIGDVLSMRLSALSRWTWGDHVPLEQRRKLNGSFSIHMHEDVLQAIFLHYIGVKWSVFFKKAFLSIRANEAWKDSRTKTSKLDRMRRNYFLGRQWIKKKGSLESARAETHQSRYFAHQLLDFETQEVEVADGEEEAEYGEHVKSNKKRLRQGQLVHNLGTQLRMVTQAARKSAPSGMPVQSPQFSPCSPGYSPTSPVIEDLDYEDDDMGFGLFDGDDGYNTSNGMGPKRPMKAKQDLLHLLSTEIIVNTHLHGELSCFRTVFESWNPLLPHQTVLQVLEFFGVSEKWKSFFTKFLEAPLKFIEDGASAQPRSRRRGTPGSHALSDMFGETVLFCLDFAVNQATDGSFVHRLYDDLWFWNKDYEKCTKAWESVTQFTKVMGVQTLTVDEHLPEGEIRWGFLYLDPSNGRFEIDHKMVDSHVEELRKQLQGKSKSVIDWIQAWNSYAGTFFSSNFGKPSNCFGREHVDKMLATHRHIQSSIFNGSNVVEHLKTMISTRFNVSDIPDGFLFFPVELGGLDLQSPFVNLLQVRESVQEDPHQLMAEYGEKEQTDYETAKKVFDKGDVRRDPRYLEHPDWKPEDASTFLSFEDFTQFRESLYPAGSADIRQTYRFLLHKPAETPIVISAQMQLALEQLRGQSNLRGITAGGMDAYWKWIAQMYGPEMCERFGGLNVVDHGLLPIGMVGFFRARRTKWEG